MTENETWADYLALLRQAHEMKMRLESKKPRARRYNDFQWRVEAAAKIYREEKQRAKEEERRATPKKLVCMMLGISKAQASRYINMATQQGLI